MSKICWLFLLFSVLFFSLRLKFFLFKKPGGVDAYYFLYASKEFKKQKSINIRLKKYLMDFEEQWYPPGFTIFLSLFPKKFLEKYHWLIAPVIDFLQFAILFLFVELYFKNILVTVLASLIYIFLPTLILETRTLTSRPLASLFFSLCFLFLFLGLFNWYFLILSVIFGVLILMTHKLATQALIFTLLCLVLFYFQVNFLLHLLLIFLVTFIISGGFYYKIILAHINIVSFWRRNINYMGSHQIFDSDFYGKTNKKNYVFYKKGFAGFFKNWLILIGHDPFFLFFLIIFILTKEVNFFFFWSASVYLIALFTTFIPKFRLFGEGYKYLKFNAFPTSIYIAQSFLILPKHLFCPIFLFFILISLIDIFGYSISIKLLHKNKKKDLVLEGSTGQEKIARKLADFFSDKKDCVVMLLPTFLSDALVYFSNVKVLWGTHSGGFHLIEDFFPILKKPIEEFFKKYNVDYFIISTDYVSYKDFKKSGKFIKFIKKLENLEIYQVKKDLI